jgi:hypothetical protein
MEYRDSQSDLILVRVNDALIREGKSAIALSSNSRLSRVTCSETLQKRYDVRSLPMPL